MSGWDAFTRASDRSAMHAECVGYAMCSIGQAIAYLDEESPALARLTLERAVAAIGAKQARLFPGQIEEQSA